MLWADQIGIGPDKIAQLANSRRALVCFDVDSVGLGTRSAPHQRRKGQNAAIGNPRD